MLSPRQQIITNVVLKPASENGLSQKSLADCFQTRPIDYPARCVRIRGKLNQQLMAQIDIYEALRIVFAWE